MSMIYNSLLPAGSAAPNDVEVDQSHHEHYQHQAEEAQLASILLRYRTLHEPDAIPGSAPDEHHPVPAPRPHYTTTDILTVHPSAGYDALVRERSILPGFTSDPLGPHYDVWTTAHQEPPFGPVRQVGAGETWGNDVTAADWRSRGSEMGFDLDSLAVEDPRRNYDFADFLDHWRFHALRDQLLPACPLGTQPSIRSWKPPDVVRRESRPHQSEDIQGIQWESLGPDRQSATVARKIWEPSRKVFSAPVDAVDASSPVLSSQGVEKFYRFRLFISRHKAEISHYQLRNCLAVVDRNSIFYAVGDKIAHASLACPLSNRMSFGHCESTSGKSAFRITCLAGSPTLNGADSGSHRTLVAGGFCGEYALVNPDDMSQAAADFVTHAYNGLVTHVQTFLDRRSGLLQAAFCSNDCTLRTLDLTSLNFVNTFRYEFAPNASSTSPDGRLTVVVGDSNQSLITDAAQGSVLVSLQGHSDYGFACAWSPNGRHIATGAQDGTVVLWDARNWSRPLCSLEATMSCARSLRFSHDDYLFAAEENDVVRIYDPHFSTVQDVRFFGSVAGVALVDGGAEVVIANADQKIGGLLCYDRTTNAPSTLHCDADVVV